MADEEEEYEEEDVLPIDKEWVDDPAQWFLRLRQEEEYLRLNIFEVWIEEELEEAPEDFDKESCRQDLHFVFDEIEKGGVLMNYARFLNALRMVQNMYEEEDIFRGLDPDESEEHSDGLLEEDLEEDSEEDSEEEEETTTGDVAKGGPREVSLREAVRVLRKHTINTGARFQELLDKIDKTEG